MLQGVFWLGDRRVNQIMRPRTRVVWLDITAHMEEILRTIEESHFTTFPVAKVSLDRVLGTVDVKGLLPDAARTQRLDLQAGLKPALMVPETLPAVRLISMFQQSRTHMAMVQSMNTATRRVS
jgi:putative hemolysin